jgi:hypothetical protein
MSSSNAARLRRVVLQAQSRQPSRACSGQHVCRGGRNRAEASRAAIAPGVIDNAVTSGAGPVKGIFQQDGVLSGALFTVSAGALYSGGVSKGAIAGSGFVNFAGNEIGLAVNAGAGVYYLRWLAVGLADFPDAANVCKVMDIGGRFLAIRTDTGKLYNTEVLENALVAGVLTFGALAFATAEDEPDPLVDGVVVGRTVALGGSETVEFWQITGDSLLPLEPILGRAYTKGVRATGCMAEFDNSAAFVSTDNLVYRCDNEPMRISDPGIEERIAASTTVRSSPTSLRATSSFTSASTPRRWFTTRRRSNGANGRPLERQTSSANARSARTGRRSSAPRWTARRWPSETFTPTLTAPWSAASGLARHWTAARLASTTCD